MAALADEFKSCSSQFIESSDLQNKSASRAFPRVLVSHCGLELGSANHFEQASLPSGRSSCQWAQCWHGSGSTKGHCAHFDPSDLCLLIGLRLQTETTDTCQGFQFSSVQWTPLFSPSSRAPTWIPTRRSHLRFGLLATRCRESLRAGLDKKETARTPGGVGLGVGAGEGDGVGPGVGAGVGLGVGPGVGAGVGDGVGAGDGLSVGPGVGPGVGDGDGDTVGDAVFLPQVAVAFWAFGCMLRNSNLLFGVCISHKSLVLKALSCFF